MTLPEIYQALLDKKTLIDTETSSKYKLYLGKLWNKAYENSEWKEIKMLPVHTQNFEVYKQKLILYKWALGDINDPTNWQESDKFYETEKDFRNNILRKDDKVIRLDYTRLEITI